MHVLLKERNPPWANEVQLSFSSNYMIKRVCQYQTSAMSVIAILNLIHLCSSVLRFEQLNSIFAGDNGVLTLVLITDYPQNRHVNVLKEVRLPPCRGGNARGLSMSKNYWFHSFKGSVWQQSSQCPRHRGYQLLMINHDILKIFEAKQVHRYSFRAMVLQES